MLVSLVLLFFINSIGICVSYGGEWHLTYEQQKPTYGPPCHKSLPYICSLPPEYGCCQPFAAITRWYYNIETGQCETFGYGGCEGNPNNFNTLIECQQCCPVYTSNVCPKVNITICQTPVNSITGQCLGGSQIADCGTACPLICGQTPPECCMEVCLSNLCQCPTDYYRRISDCQCLKKECCKKPEQDPSCVPEIPKE